MDELPDLDVESKVRRDETVKTPRPLSVQDSFHGRGGLFLAFQASHVGFSRSPRLSGY